MKYILVTPDGLPDRPQASLDGQTPLAAAKTPTLDRLAADGRLAQASILTDESRLDSSIALMIILGYRGAPVAGRGYYESLDSGVALAEHEWVARAQFVSIDDEALAEPNVKPSTTETRQLIQQLNDAEIAGVRFHFTDRANYLCVLDERVVPYTQAPPPWRLRGGPLAAGFDSSSEALLEVLRKTQNVLEECDVNVQRRELGEPPANMVYLWGAGRRESYQSLSDQYGVSSSVVSYSMMARGVALAVGAGNALAPEQSREPRDELRHLARGARDAIVHNDLVVVHVGFPDNYAPSRDPRGKVRAIELIDEFLLRSLLAMATERGDTRIAIVPTVVSDSSSSTHVADPVPCLVWGPGVNADAGERYTEAAAEQSGTVLDVDANIVDAFVRA